MRLLPRVTMALIIACAAVLLPTAGASATYPPGWPPCAAAEQKPETNYAKFVRGERGGGSATMGAEFAVTCPGATYDFIFTSAIPDKDKKPRPLGWSGTTGNPKDSWVEVDDGSDTVVTVRFIGNGDRVAFSVGGSTANSYFNHALGWADQCLNFSIRISLSDVGPVYELPQEGPDQDGYVTVCVPSGGANNNF